MNTQSVVEKFKAGGYDSASGANANPDPTDNGRQLNSKDKGSDESLTLYEVKVNGQVKKFTLDELKSRASKSDAADENFRKAAEIEKASKERASKWNEWWTSTKKDYPDLEVPEELTAEITVKPDKKDNASEGLSEKGVEMLGKIRAGKLTDEELKLINTDHKYLPIKQEIAITENTFKQDINILIGTGEKLTAEDIAEVRVIWSDNPELSVPEAYNSYRQLKGEIQKKQLAGQGNGQGGSKFNVDNKKPLSVEDAVNKFKQGGYR